MAARTVDLTMASDCLCAGFHREAKGIEGI